MSDGEQYFHRSNSLNSLNTGSYSYEGKILRWRSVDRSTFLEGNEAYPQPTILWDAEKKEQIMRHRLQLATLNGVINLSRMQLESIPDVIFYLEMDTEEKENIKHDEILQEYKIKNLLPTKTVSVELKKSIAERIRKFPVSKCDTSLPNEENFQFFLDSILPGYKYDSYGEIIKAYLKQETAKFIQHRLDNSTPTTHKQYRSQPIGTGSVQTKTGTISKIPVRTCQKIPTTVQPCTSKIPKPVYNLQTISSDHLKSKIPVRTAQPKVMSTKLSEHKYIESGLKSKDGKKTSTVHRNQQMATGSAQARKGIISKIPVKITKKSGVTTKTSLQNQFTSYSTKKCDMSHTVLEKNDPPLKTSVSRKTPFKKSTLLPRHDETKIPKSVQKKSKSVMTGSSVEAGNSSKTFVTADQNYCFVREYSLIGVNPYTGEKICVLKNIQDSDEIKNKICSFLYDLNSSEASKSSVHDISTSFTGDLVNHINLDDNPVNNIFFQGDSLMYENPITLEEFPIFQNIKDIEEVKKEVTQVLMSCVSESTNISSFSSKDISAATYAPGSFKENSYEGNLVEKMSCLKLDMTPLATSTPKNVNLHSDSKKQTFINKILSKHSSKRQGEREEGNSELNEAQAVCDVTVQQKRINKIHVLIMDGNKIKEISSKIGYLTNLIEINCKNNMLTVIPSELRKLQKLEKLYLDNNKITTLHVGLYDITSLRHLSLSGNKLIHVSILLRYLINLQYLDISDNYLTELPNVLHKLRNLTHLKISRNEITKLPENLPANLQKLYANGNKIGQLPDLSCLRHLRVLSVCANKLTELPTMPSCTKKIYANLNFISHLNESLIENWTELESLHLSQNKLYQLPENVVMMSSLRKLRLSHNKIKYLPRSLHKMSNLVDVDLRANPLLEIPYHLKEDPNINFLFNYMSELDYRGTEGSEEVEAEVKTSADNNEKED